MPPLIQWRKISDAGERPKGEVDTELLHRPHQGVTSGTLTQTAITGLSWMTWWSLWLWYTKSSAWTYSADLATLQMTQHQRWTKLIFKHQSGDTYGLLGVPFVGFEFLGFTVPCGERKPFNKHNNNKLLRKWVGSRQGGKTCAASPRTGMLSTKGDSDVRVWLCVQLHCAAVQVMSQSVSRMMLIKAWEQPVLQITRNQPDASLLIFMTS